MKYLMMYHNKKTGNVCDIDTQQTIAGAREWLELREHLAKTLDFHPVLCNDRLVINDDNEPIGEYYFVESSKWKKQKQN